MCIILSILIENMKNEMYFIFIFFSMTKKIYYTQKCDVFMHYFFSLSVYCGKNLLFSKTYIIIVVRVFSAGKQVSIVCDYMERYDRVAAMQGAWIDIREPISLCLVTNTEEQRYHRHEHDLLRLSAVLSLRGLVSHAHNQRASYMYYAALCAVHVRILWLCACKAGVYLATSIWIRRLEIGQWKVTRVWTAMKRRCKYHLSKYRFYIFSRHFSYILDTLNVNVHIII